MSVVDAARTQGRHVLVVTLDVLAARMAGPAIRAWEISRALAVENDVRLATFGTCDRTGEGFETRHIDPGDFRAQVDWADVVILQGFIAASFPWLQDADVVLVADLYDPFHVESLEVQRDDPLPDRQAALAGALRELDAQVRRADLFLCASHRQRDLWLGHLAAAGRVNPMTYDADPDLRSLLTIVPFGMADEPPRQERHAIRGAVPGIGPDDHVVIWGGGVYNWFDTLTLVSAIDRVRHDVPDVRLFFLGMKHPNPDVPQMRMAVRTRALSDELGLTGRHVFFNDEWVPYEKRADYLLDADLGVSCHFPSLETEFSFRTRILDYLWAGLPMVTTEGDAFADLITANGLGVVVPPEDVDALAEALSSLLRDRERRDRCSEAVRREARAFEWPVALAPLVEFCRDPRRAADLQRPAGPGRLLTVTVARRSPATLARALLRHYRSGGLRQVLSRVRWWWVARGRS